MITAIKRLIECHVRNVFPIILVMTSLIGVKSAVTSSRNAASVQECLLRGFTRGAEAVENPENMHS